MAYNFPSSPTVGQEVNGYIWDGQKWVKRQPGDATISTTPPTDAHPGQLWWDSDNGDLYIYYHDGSSAQWVGVDTSGSGGGSFIQEGAGAVSRTLEDKARETFSVLDFGAVGDGIADDTAPIQAALNAINATPAKSGSLHFPGGYTFKAVGLTWASIGRLDLVGDGTGSVISIANDTGNLFTGDGFNASPGGERGTITVKNLTVQHPVHNASTAGFFFIFRNAQVAIDGVHFYQGYNGIRFEDGCNQCTTTNVLARGQKNDLFQVDVTPGGGAPANGNLHFDGITAQGYAAPGTCMRVISIDGLFVSNSLFAGFQNGVVVTPSASRGYAANLYFTNVCVDAAGSSASAGPGWYFDGSAQALLRVYLTGCWAGAFPGRGVNVKDTKVFSWIGGSIIQNGQYGMVFEGACQDVLLRDLVVTGNSMASSGANDGILVYNGVNKISIKNCRIGATHNAVDSTTQLNTQNAGIRISDPGTIHYELIGNDVSGNVSAGIADNGGAGGRRIVRDNVGYNPLGTALLTPGASPWTYAAKAVPETVYVAGGVVSAIAIDGQGVAFGISGGPATTVALSPNQTMTVTYTTVPAAVVANRQ